MRSIKKIGLVGIFFFISPLRPYKITSLSLKVTAITEVIISEHINIFLSRKMQ